MLPTMAAKARGCQAEHVVIPGCTLLGPANTPVRSGRCGESAVTAQRLNYLCSMARVPPLPVLHWADSARDEESEVKEQHLNQQHLLPALQRAFKLMRP
jgi:hypothetical protein